MKVLVIGGGGREHAMAWRLLQAERVSRVYIAPGNGGTALDPGCRNVPLTDIDALIEFVRKESIALTVVGPEAPLAAGIVDAFQAAGLRIFGPRRAAAQLESSKDYAKQFMKRHGIPTAESATFSVAAEAHAYLDEHSVPIVIKADGLAAGKGVVVAQTLDQAHAAVDDMLSGNSLGEAGSRVVIEAFLQGEEASFIVMVDGKNVLALASSQDHKRLGDGDSGPNTGGMGAYSPAPIITPEMHRRVMREIILPTVLGMEQEGIAYTGFLYAGLMIDDQGQPRVLEFNCRLGDPEAQVIMMRMKSDFFQVLDHAIDGRLDAIDCEWDRRVALGVVMAAPGYPEKPELGASISLAPITESQHEAGVQVFHAGTRIDDANTLRVSGGRVLCVAALGESVRSAQRSAYEATAQVNFSGAQFRHDIGWRALARKTPEKSA